MLKIFRACQQNNQIRLDMKEKSKPFPDSYPSPLRYDKASALTLRLAIKSALRASKNAYALSNPSIGISKVSADLQTLLSAFDLFLEPPVFL